MLRAIPRRRTPISRHHRPASPHGPTAKPASPLTPPTAEPKARQPEARQHRKLDPRGSRNRQPDHATGRRQGPARLASPPGQSACRPSPQQSPETQPVR